MTARLLWFAVLIGLATATCPPAQAQSLFERLVMPGDLIEGHRKLESDCSNCHESFARDRQSPLCAGCHKDVAADIAADLGFHGHSAMASGQECSHCHTDHIGREADIVGLDSETFDHSLTDFDLAGAHRVVSCAGCHDSVGKYREAPGTCFECHQHDDPHKKRLGKDCATCHQVTAWRPIRGFDHDTTEFRLIGAHRALSCQSCHAGEVYTGLPETCDGCHRIQDVHLGEFGDKCDTCHGAKRWTEVRFDHDADTDFALRGLHADVACDDCHTGDTAGKLPTTCFGCHGPADPHQGQLGKKCESCHQETGWRRAVAFDHDITRFPLIGLHVLAPCEACHLDAEFQTAASDCNACHRNDDMHKGALGTECETCHNPNGWAFWRFDHDGQTNFALEGSHMGLECAACHPATQNASAQSESAPTDSVRACIDCHRRDDVHRGRYGQDCSLCHGSDDFANARLR